MKIGFVDYYLDNWHANNFPEMIAKQSGGKAVVAYAFGLITSPLSGMTSEQWCEKYGVEYCATIEEVIEKSDVLLVLSPEHGEMHEILSELPLKSGKKTYIDKTFAPTRKMAESIMALAEKCGTPCYSTSALRFAEEYQPLREKEILAGAFVGPSEIDNYSIHQLEPIVMLMKAAPCRVMALKREDWSQLMLEWRDGRCATMTLSGDWKNPFSATVLTPDGAECVQVNSAFFDVFIQKLLHFYETGEIPVCHEETISIAATREACLKAVQTPGQWVDVP